MFFLYAPVVRSISTFALLLVLVLPASAQVSEGLEKAVIRIKVTEPLSAALENASLTTNPKGYVVTGVAPIDRVNDLFRVYKFKRVFPPAGKNEARHRKYGLHRWYELRMDVPGLEFDAVTSFKSLSQIEKAEVAYEKAINDAGKHRVVRYAPPRNGKAGDILSGTNDPMFSSQWHYHNTGQTGGTVGSDIRLLNAWKAETGKRSVIVAIMDGGVEGIHEDLAANMWHNEGEVAGNNIDDDRNGYIDDVTGYNFYKDTGTINSHYHGTHVAGTIGAVTNNGVGVAGIAGGTGNSDGVRLMSCVLFDDGNSNNRNVAAAYVYAADHGALISQNSWGYTIPNSYEQTVLDAIDYFIAEAGRDSDGKQIGLMSGGLVTFSASNDNSEEPYYPGYYSPVLTVAATNHNDVRSFYSNYGSWVDISAPGGETEEAENQGVLSTLDNGGYGYLQGTSMACPHVTGVAALVISRFGKSGFNAEGLRKRLTSTADNVDAHNGSFAGKLGAGRVNAERALTETDNVPPTAITNLHIIGKANGEVTLKWTTPADARGFISYYDVRFSTRPITAANFAAAASAGNVPATASQGEDQRFKVTGLMGQTRFYFAVKAIDFYGNVSPISNIVSVITPASPSITITPTTISQTLSTAETITRTASITNTGKTTLTFTIQNPGATGDPIQCHPFHGSLAPKSSQLLTFTFDADRLPPGTHNKTFILESNDPIAPESEIHTSLTVTPNGVPIAEFLADRINFRGVKVSNVRERSLRIANAGSQPLQIKSVSIDNSRFTTSLTVPTVIASFDELQIPISFKPISAGVVKSKLTIKTNDPKRAVIQIDLIGEGLSSDPIVATPSKIAVTLENGSIHRQDITLKNNTSFDQPFHIESIVGDPAAPEASKGRSNGRTRSEKNKMSSERLTFLDKFRNDEINVDSLFKRVGARQKGISRHDEVARVDLPDHRYETNFEEFEYGGISGQQGWTALQTWEVSRANPANGTKHLRATATAAGSLSYAITPEAYEEDVLDQQYHTFSTLVNLDDAGGDQWEIVVQDFYFVTTRISINPDRTIDIMSVGPNYETVWTRLDHPQLEGYAEMAVELNTGAQGFPSFDLFVNGARVFKGFSVGFFMSSAVFISYPEQGGSSLDVDSVAIYPGRYVPRYIKATPDAGIIPAHGTAKVDVAFDPSGLRFETYNSQIIAHMDGSDDVVIPVSASVISEPKLQILSEDILFVDSDFLPAGFYMSNLGGEPFTYTITKKMPELMVYNPSGTIASDSDMEIQLDLDPNLTPGFYSDTLYISTNIPGEPVHNLPVEITVHTQETEFNLSTKHMHFEVSRGGISTQTFSIWKVNFDPADPGEYPGTRDVVYRILKPADADYISVTPSSGTVRGHQVQTLSVRFDPSMLPDGSGTTTLHVSNTANPYRLVNVSYTVVSNDVNAKALREIWSNVPGRNVSSIPVHQSPSAREYLTTLSGPVNSGDLYGARIQGLIEAPLTGEYIFYLSSDDESELWLSTDRDPANKTRIAFLQHAVPVGVYEKFPTQKSLPITLEAGKKYYIEILHKEHMGKDHVSVGWKLPNGMDERPIPSTRLSLPGALEPNTPPVVSLLAPSNSQSFAVPASVLISASALDSDGTISKVEFFKDDEKVGEDIMPPFELRWNNSDNGTYLLTAKATDNKGGVGSASAEIHLTNEGCFGTGYLTREVWKGIAGEFVSEIPYNTAPTEMSYITSFEAPQNNGENYGSRIRGYVCAPETGNYTFWISSDDRSELWLSTDDTPQNRKLICYVSGYTAPLQWDKYFSQRSASVRLVEGKRYYVEALHKESRWLDHLAVGWKTPSGELQRPMPYHTIAPFLNDDRVLSPMVAADLADNSEVDDQELFEEGASIDASVFPNPVHRGVVTIAFNDILDVTNVTTAQLRVATLTGKETYHAEFDPVSNGGEVSLSIDDSYAPGVYIVQLVIGKRSVAKRLMVH